MTDYDFTWDDGFWVTNRHVPFLCREVEIVVVPEDLEEARPTHRQIAAIDALDDVPDSIVKRLNDAADGHRRRIHDLIDLAEEGLGDICRENIADYFEIDEIVIPPLGDCARVYHFLSADCDWEPEHGLEFLLRDGEVVSCTNQDCLYLDEAWRGHLR